MEWQLYFKREKSRFSEYFPTKEAAELKLLEMYHEQVRQFYGSELEKWFTGPQNFETFSGFYQIERKAS